MRLSNGLSLLKVHQDLVLVGKAEKLNKGQCKASVID